MLRWAVPTSEVGADSGAPADADADADALLLPLPRALLALLPHADADDVRRFARPEDRRRALLSRLLQRAAPAAALGLPADALRRRAANGRGRPFLCRAAALAASSAAARGRDDDACDDTHDPLAALAAAPNWNFSASHEGKWLALVAEPLALCGCDIAAPRDARRRRQQGGNFLESVALLRGCFTDSEWAVVERPLLQRQRQRRQRSRGEEGKPAGGGGGDDDDGNDDDDDGDDDDDNDDDDDGDDDDEEAEARAEAAFLRLWAVKEAFVKARGDGLAFSPLSRVEAVWREEEEEGGGGQSQSQPRAFDDARRVAAAARAGERLAVGALSVDGSPAQWGRWAVAVHPLPVEDDDEDDEEEERALSPRTPGVAPSSPRPHSSSRRPRHRHRRRCWLAVVRGPPSEAAPRDLHPDFVDSLARRSLGDDELRRAVEEAPWSPLKVLKIEDLLLSEREREAVAAAAAAQTGRRRGSS